MNRAVPLARALFARAAARDLLADAGEMSMSEAAVPREAFSATFIPRRNVDGVRSFRALLKFAGRQLGLRAVDIRQIEISDPRRPQVPVTGPPLPRDPGDIPF
jgi:hypothetical protein